MKSCQNEMWSKLKVVKIKRSQKWSKLKLVKTKSGLIEKWSKKSGINKELSNQTGIYQYFTGIYPYSIGKYQYIKLVKFT